MLPMVLLCSITAAFASSYDVMDFYTDYKKVIADMYQGIDAIIPEEERTACSATGASPVYGEIVYESCAVLLAELKLTENDVFYDLGSGLGKFVTQVYLTSAVKKAWGVEFSENRYKRATDTTKNLAKIQGQAFKFENEIRKTFGKSALTKTKGKEFGFDNMDMLKADLSDATVVFTCSTCFGPEFMQKLTDKLAENDGLRILTLVQLPYNKHVHEGATYVLPMTWSAETPVYMYKVDHSREAKKPEGVAEATAQVKEEPVVSVVVPEVQVVSEEQAEETPELVLDFADEEVK